MVLKFLEKETSDFKNAVRRVELGYKIPVYMVFDTNDVPTIHLTDHPNSK